MMGTGDGVTVIPESPYRGILPFLYADRHRFFGRKDQINELTAKILIYRLVVVFGESGAGKSSLLNAGIVPALLKEHFLAERLRVRPFPAAPILAERIVAESAGRGYVPSVSPGGGTWSGASQGPSRIASYLSSVFPESEGSTDGAETSISLQQFRNALGKAPAAAPPVLIFDQFEELFTLFEPDHRPLQKLVLDEIYALINSRDLVAKVVIVIREDFVGKIETLAKEYPQVFDRRVRLSSLSSVSALQAIRGPFPEGHHYESEITAELASRIVQDFTGGDEDVLIHSTQLQIVCSRLWEEHAVRVKKIGEDEYRDMGGLRGILEGFLKSEIGKLPAGERELAYFLMGEMVTQSGTRDVVSEDRLRGAFDGKPEASLRQAFAETGTLRWLEQLRLINRTPQRGVYYYEIASEYLIAPIKAFNEARDRAEAEKKAAEDAQAELMELARQREVEHSLQLVREQTARAEQEARSARRLRFLLAQLFLLLIVVAGLAYTALQQKRTAEDQASELKAALQENSKRLDLFRQNVRLKQNALSGDLSRISSALRESPSQIRFHVEATRARNAQGQQVIRFEFYPVPETVSGGLNSLALISYKLDHPTFETTIYPAGPDRSFHASYEGWGALSRVVAVIEYNDPDKKVEVGSFNMLEILGW